MRWAWFFLSASLLLGAPAYAEEPSTYPEGKLLPFLGLDDTSVETAVEDGRAQDLQNMSLTISRSLKKRDGIDLIGDVLDIPDETWCVTTGLAYVKFSSTTERIVATCGNRFYTLGASTVTQVPTSPTLITAGKNNQFVWSVALDQLIGTNGNDLPLQYNGTIITSVTFTGLTNAIQKARQVVFFKNYLIFLNTTEAGTTYPTRFRWSNVGTINTWTDANYIDIDALQGQEINAVAVFYDALYVFLTDSIYKVSLVGGSDTFQVAKVVDGVGCVGKNALQVVSLPTGQVGALFLDKRKKVYFFNGSTPQDISLLIQTAMTALNATRLPYAVSANTGTEYWVCASNGSAVTNDKCLVFNYQLNEWLAMTNIPANSMASNVVDSLGKVQTYWGNYLSMVYQLQNTSLTDDVGTAVGQVKAVSTYTTSTASGLQVLYDSALAMTTGTLVGAPIKLTGGVGAGLTGTIAYNTTTGLVVTSAFSTTPTTTTNFEVGAIDSYYETKWYDLGSPARLKHFGEIYLWAALQADSSLNVSYAYDFQAPLETLVVPLTSTTTGGVWDVSLWDVSTWSDVSPIFKQVKLQSQGRYMSLKFAEDDPVQTFHLLGWTPIWWPGDVN